MYPNDFTPTDLSGHIDDLLTRFQNVALKDTLYRVGCDLKRKLGPDDRLVNPIRQGIKLNKEINKILYVLVCGFYFRATDEEGKIFLKEQEIFSRFTHDIKILLINISGFDPAKDKTLIIKAKNFCREINKRFNPVVTIN